MKDIYSSLNEKQLEAVKTIEGPVMVMAGAGSGKTRVLTNRIAYLTNELGVYPTQILAVTFTNKAAREMKERLSKMCDDDVEKMWISTFHSMCCRILRVEISHLEGYSNNFTIIDDEDSLKIIKEVTKELNYSVDDIKPKDTKNIISAFKNDTLESIDNEDIFAIYNAYEKRLKAENLLDFDDLIIKTLDVFDLYPAILEKYQNKFSYILVDEFQDTNTKQYRLVKLLAFRHKNIFVVGDQDQSIYSFRGAKIENINKFLKDFVGTKVIMLEENYRSTQNILNIANKVIKNNSNRFDKNLYTKANEGSKPVYYNADTSYAEVMYVLDKIKELKASGYEYKDMAILYRSNYLSRGFEDIFVRYGIPYTIYGGLSFFARKEVKDILAYLRLIINSDDDFSFKRVVNEPKRKIGPALVGKLVDEGIDKHQSLFKSIDTISKSGQGYNALIDFKFTILELQEALMDSNMPLEDIINVIIVKTGYKNMLLEDGEEGKERLGNVLELKSVIKEADEFYDGSKKEKLEQMLSEIALRTDTDKKRENDDVVKLMSYHQSKGLEYKVVFLIAFEEGIFPSSLCFSHEELEEERRICYVGITRAREKLFITCAKSRSLYGRNIFSMPSRYVSEIGENNLDLYTPNVKSNKTNIVSEHKTFVPGNISSVQNIKREDSTSFNIGDKINHKAFGDGTIVSISGDVLTVAFGEAFGVKKLLASHPSIRKI